jgi:hypothetical protein
MAQAIGKYAAKKMLNSQLKQYKSKEPVGTYDPYYEYRTDPRSGKQKKYKKQIPSYIPEADADLLAKVRKRAYMLDMSLFNFLGIRFGWSSVIGIVPAIGDALDGIMAMLVVRKCMQVKDGLPTNVIMNMLIWVFIDFFIGLVPFVGDLLDASIRANTKNVRILEKHLDAKYKPKEISRRERDEEEEAKRRNHRYTPPAPATVYESFSDDEELPQYSTRPHSPARHNEPSRPNTARVPAETRGGVLEDRPREDRHREDRHREDRHRDERRRDDRPQQDKKKKSWFGGGREPSRRERTDVEMAQTDGPVRSGSRRN